MKLELVPIGVSDVDRAKEWYTAAMAELRPLTIHMWRIDSLKAESLHLLPV